MLQLSKFTGSSVQMINEIAIFKINLKYQIESTRVFLFGFMQFETNFPKAVVLAQVK